MQKELRNDLFPLFFPFIFFFIFQIIQEAFTPPRLPTFSGVTPAGSDSCC